MKKIFAIIGVVGLMVLTWYISKQAYECPDYELTKSDTTSVKKDYDTTNHVVGREDLEVQREPDSSAPSIPQDTLRLYRHKPVDSAAIAEAYYAKYRGNLTYRDSNVALDFKYNLTENTLYNPSLEYKLLQPTSTYKVTNEYRPATSPFRVYAGLGVGYNPRTAFWGPEVNFAWKSNLIGLRSNVLDDQPNIQLSYSYKLFEL